VALEAGVAVGVEAAKAAPALNRAVRARLVIIFMADSASGAADRSEEHCHPRRLTHRWRPD
jgi:hypothetical protein